MPATTLSSSPQWFTAAVDANSKDPTTIYYLNRKSKSMGDDSAHSHRRRRSTLTKMVDVPKKTKKNLKPVKFHDSEGSCVVHQLESNPDVDFHEMWYSKQEIRALRKEGQAILAKVKQAGGDVSAALDESIGESIRGLEHGLSVHDYDSGWNGSFAEDIVDAPLDRSERRKNIVATILAQQQEHKDDGIDDPKGLASTSKASTQWARDRAFDVAQKDFDDAVEIWRQDADCERLLPSILNRKKGRRRSSVISVASDCSTGMMSADERKATLDTISKTVASALEELDDLDF